MPAVGRRRRGADQQRAGCCGAKVAWLGDVEGGCGSGWRGWVVRRPVRGQVVREQFMTCGRLFFFGGGSEYDEHLIIGRPWIVGL